MPKRAKGARLHWRAPKNRSPFWEIRDGNTRLSTSTDDRREAESALAEYIERKNRPVGPTSPDDLSVSMALSLYGEEHAAHVASPERIGYAIDALDKFWRDLPVSAVKGETCRRYAKSRVTRHGKPASAGTIRRELNVLQAAINHCHREGYLTQAPKVVMPAKPPAKERWLTRQEAAWLLRAARSLNRDGRHLADFILCGLYTGSRKDTILRLHIDRASPVGGHVDTVQGILYRRPGAKAETKKRQTPARLPDRYLAHLRRQAANGRIYVVEREIAGERAMVGDIRKAWARARDLAAELADKQEIEIDLSDVTPHTLKHTAITWAMQRGATIWDAAGYFGTSAETIERVYGHHSPHHQQSAVDAMNRRG
ncbi:MULTISPECIES: tyrosine-type recombinase/integrase [unclassified Mameliella]|uniref:tyrosine-type recombinase/integrase n=1 Tax=Mameliella sp. LZ-28 TaxID=2484146 RepID=UPI00143F938C|nr:integrase [Mameliella sp. LZ-28]